MAPPLSDIKISGEATPGTKAQPEVHEGLELARQLAKEPFRLSPEQRERITAGVLSKMGY